VDQLVAKLPVELENVVARPQLPRPMSPQPPWLPGEVSSQWLTIKTSCRISRPSISASQMAL
jgi:hypothetical protein